MDAYFVLQHYSKNRKSRYESIAVFRWRDYQFKDDDTTMRKPKGKQNGNKTTNRNSNVNAPMRWINIQLTDEDLLILDGQSADTTELALSIVELAIEGADIGIKRTDGGASIMAYAIADDSHVEGGRFGVSAYASNVPDAVSALLYKIDVKLHDGIPAPSTSAARRFR